MSRLECGGETHYQLGRYEILRPYKTDERQILRDMTTFLQDFTEGARQFTGTIGKSARRTAGHHG